MDLMNVAAAAHAANGRQPVGKRDPAAAAERKFIYVARFVCGQVDPCDCGCLPLASGSYATAILIHNCSLKTVEVVKRFVPVVIAGTAIAREPNTAAPRAEDRLILPPQAATMDDCCAIVERLLGWEGGGSHPVFAGVVEITASADVAVSTVYTTRGLKLHGASIAVERIASL